MFGDGKFLLLCVAAFLAVQIESKMKTVRSWKSIDYLWNSVEQKQKAIENNLYNLSAVIPYDVDESEDGRIFVTIVRQPGVPASLNVVSNKRGPGGPLLMPYPNWNSALRTDCKGIISVYRVVIHLNTLYVLDCGTNGNIRVCPAKVLMYNLRTNRLLRIITIPDNVAQNKNGAGLLVTPVLDSGRHGDYLYIADIEGWGLIVLNLKTEESWRIEIDAFLPDKNATTFTIGKDSFSIEDGLIGLSLSKPMVKDGISTKVLYVNALAGYKMYSLLTYQLKIKNNSNVTYFTEPMTMESQSAAQAMSDSQILFYSQISLTTINCYDTSKLMLQETTDVVYENSITAQFASGMKTKKNKLLVMTNRLPQVLAETINYNDTNFRILSGNIADLVSGTKCDTSKKPRPIPNQIPVTS